MLLLTGLHRTTSISTIVKPLAKRSFIVPSVPRSFHLKQPHIIRNANAVKSPLFATKRFFTTEPAVITRPPRTESYRKLLTSAGLFGGTLIAANILFNSGGREGEIPAFERQYLKETFLYTGLGVGMIGAAAKALHNIGFAHRIMTANPWVVLGLGVVGSVATMAGTLYMPPENYIAKHAFWAAFNLTNSAVLAPLLFLSPALLARAGLYTLGIMGTISYVAATAKEDKFIFLGGPLLAGCAVAALSGLAPLVLPVGSRALVGAEVIWLYGGLAVFGGFTLYDVQKVLQNARLAERGLIRKDTVNESIGLTLDFLNIFVRLATIFQAKENRR
jgi:FtsH-binding integral membrane protein